MRDTVKITIEVERGVLYMRHEYVAGMIGDLVNDAIHKLRELPSITEPEVTVRTKLNIEGARRPCHYQEEASNG